MRIMRIFVSIVSVIFALVNFFKAKEIMDYVSRQYFGPFIKMIPLVILSGFFVALLFLIITFTIFKFPRLTMWLLLTNTLIAFFVDMTVTDKIHDGSYAIMNINWLLSIILALIAFFIARAEKKRLSLHVNTLGNNDSTMSCDQCGHELMPQATFCSNCGTKVQTKHEPELENISYAAVPPIEEKLQLSNKDVRYAGFWLRVAAIFLDNLILSPLCFIMFAIITSEEYRSGRTYITPWFIFLGLSVLIYHVLLESSPMRGTLGKKIVGIVIVNEDGSRISFGKALGRYFGKAVSSLIINIGYMMAGWTEKKQALHDMMAGTYVIRKN